MQWIRVMTVFQFRLRTLFVVTTLTAIATLPSYRLVLKAFQTWMQQGQPVGTQLFTTVNTVVTVPDGGTTLVTGSGIWTTESDNSEQLSTEQILREATPAGNKIERRAWHSEMECNIQPQN
jgi:hypothetical protein